MIEGGAAPRFSLTGRGEIQVITVSGPDLKHQAQQGSSNDDLPQPMKPYWEIVPKSNLDLHDLEKRGPLVYGQIPEGFRQNYPANGAAPPALFDGGLFT